MYTTPKKSDNGTQNGDSQMSYGSGYGLQFKDFYIAIGQPGPYKKDMDYTIVDDFGVTRPNVIGLYQNFDIRIKHAPLSLTQSIKNVVVQTWLDEDGDDIFLPYTTGPNGEKLPAVTHESVEYTPTFVMFCPNYGEPVATQNIHRLIELIQGRWLKIWDEYSQLGYDGVVLKQPDADPRFKRRNYDFIEFSLTFIVNGTSITAPFEGINQ